MFPTNYDGIYAYKMTGCIRLSVDSYVGESRSDGRNKQAIFSMQVVKISRYFNSFHYYVW